MTLGKVIAHIRVIEFQKRGLPHAHILLIMHIDDKPRTMDDVDTAVSAEIPDPDLSPLAHATVTKHIMHGPCGQLDKEAVCMVNDVCSKNFPHPFSTTTRSDNSGYPKYRRRDDGKEATKNGCRLDNRWVVPHNVYLCTKYNAHINVEVCTTVSAVKYLYKYVYKGHDRASVSMTRNATTVIAATATATIITTTINKCKVRAEVELLAQIDICIAQHFGGIAIG